MLSVDIKITPGGIYTGLPTETIANLEVCNIFSHPNNISDYECTLYQDGKVTFGYVYNHNRGDGALPLVKKAIEACLEESND